MKPVRASASSEAPSRVACCNIVAEKLADASPRCAALIGVPYTASSHPSAARSNRLTWACTSRIRTDSFQPSPSRSSAPGSMISMKCRVFCRMRRGPCPVVTRPVM